QSEHLQFLRAGIVKNRHQLAKFVILRLDAAGMLRDRKSGAGGYSMNRRDFMKVAAAGTASMFGGYVAYAADQKTYRVGLIGAGWYGKNDLLRLIQVAPVEVVSLCDVDKHRLSQGADQAAARQKSGKTPRTYSDYRRM